MRYIRIVPPRKTTELLTRKLDALPQAPGVYVFRGTQGVLYVGKARNLRSRVRSYFQPSSSDQRFFIERLDKTLNDIETLVVNNEREAALLERQLIREHKPLYNFKLRDDKEYLSLRLDPKASWPRLEVVRRPQKDQAWYFGPYHSASGARQTLRLVNRHFQLRTCTDSELSSRTRPCLQYQIKRCPAPCVYEVDAATYQRQTTHARLFLQGKHDTLLGELTQDMRDAAVQLQYEDAARLRDQIQAIERIQQKQSIEVHSRVDSDVLGLFREADDGELVVMQVRQGKLREMMRQSLDHITAPDDEILASFIADYYTRVPCPNEILIAMPVEASVGLTEMLSENAGKKVRIIFPQRGRRAALVKLAQDNAAHAYREKARALEASERRLQELQQLIGLSTLPVRIECVDISHSAGKETVGAIVVLENGVPAPKHYRTYRLRSNTAGDDYAAMYEVLSRRIRRRAEEGWTLPDLLILDGGKGQLGIALSVLRDLSVTDLPVMALAKERKHPLKPDLVDRLYLPGQANPIEVRRHTACLHLISLIRDEAHRVSNRYRKQLSAKIQFRSRLRELPGLGPVTVRKLLRNLGSMKAVMRASLEDLEQAGATSAQALAIYNAYHEHNLTGDPAVTASDGVPELAVTALGEEERAVTQAFELLDDPPTDKSGEDIVSCV